MRYLLHIWGLIHFLIFATSSFSQSIIIIEDCDQTYIDPQDANSNSTESRDTLIYKTTFGRDSFLREFYVDINAFGGQQVDRTRVYAILEDSTRKPLGEMAFGNCLTCVKGFAFMHDGMLQTENEADPSVMQLWLQSFNQPDFGIIGNLQTLNGVGRISGKIPFCAVGLEVEFIVNSNPNNATTEFSTHIICPREIASCIINKEVNIDCINDQIRLNAVVPPECFSSSARIEWQKDGQTISSDALFEGTLTDNEGWYYFTIVDDCCILRDSVLVENPAFAKAGPDLNSCLGETITLNGTGGQDHFWEKLNGTTFQDSMPNLTGLSQEDSGSYVLHAFNEDGCEDTDTLILEVIVPPTPQLSSNDACVGDTLRLQVVNAQQYSSLSWQDPVGSPIDSIILDFGLADFGSYTLEALDTFRCSIQSSIDITGNQPPDFTFDIVETCDSSRIFLYPESLNYQWQDGTQNNDFVTSRGGNFQVTITDAEGCSTIETVSLPEPDGPEVNFEIEQPLCPDDNGSIRILPKDINRPMIFSIDGGATYGFETYYNQLGPGNYKVIIQDDLECIQEFDIELIRPDTLWVELNIDSNYLVVRPGTLIELSAITVGQVEEIQWLPNEINTDELNTSFIANNNMDIRIIVRDANNCFVSDALQLTVEIGEVYSPNAFSPNKDSNNEYFTLYSDLGSGEIIELLQVYDRYGNLLFTRKEINLNQPELGWDGTFKGELMTTGVYTFLGIVRFGNGQRKIYEGDVMLVR